MDISLNKGLATVKLRAGNTVRPEEFWGAIRKNGFTPKDTRVVVRGILTAAPQPSITVAGGNEVFRLKANEQLLQETAHNGGKTVVVEGTMTPAKDLKASAIDVRSIKATQ